MSNQKKITLEKVLPVLRELEVAMAEAGYHTALTGSVLYKGGSDDDVDVILYPHNPEVRLTDDALQQLLEGIGYQLRLKTSIEYVNRSVWICKHIGSNFRFDFFLSDTSHK